MVPWWHVAQPRSFRHVTASFCRKVSPRSIAFRPCCDGDSVGAFFSESPPRAGLSATAKTPSATIAKQMLKRECMCKCPLRLTLQGRATTAERSSSPAWAAAATLNPGNPACGPGQVQRFVRPNRSSRERVAREEVAQHVVQVVPPVRLPIACLLRGEDDRLPVVDLLPRGHAGERETWVAHHRLMELPARSDEPGAIAVPGVLATE